MEGEIENVSMEDDFEITYDEDEEDDEDDPLGAKFLYDLIGHRLKVNDVRIMLNMLNQIMFEQTNSRHLTRDS
jgi:hypothetical protein